jgi:hypothetical protein
VDDSLTGFFTPKRDSLLDASHRSRHLPKSSPSSRPEATVVVATPTMLATEESNILRIDSPCYCRVWLTGALVRDPCPRISGNMASGRDVGVNGR